MYIGSSIGYDYHSRDHSAPPIFHNRCHYRIIAFEVACHIYVICIVISDLLVTTIINHVDDIRPISCIKMLRNVLINVRNTCISPSRNAQLHSKKTRNILDKMDQTCLLIIWIFVPLVYQQPLSWMNKFRWPCLSWRPVLRFYRESKRI